MHKAKDSVDVVTIEGNASNQVMTKVHQIKIDGSGRITCGFKGWGRPPEFGGGAPQHASDGGDEPEWMRHAAEQQKHFHGKHTDR